MFDIGFWELLVISVIGLVVLGPERLPVAIRTVSDWIKGVKSFSRNVQNEISQELRIQELHADLKKAEQSKFEDISPEVAKSLKSLKEAAESVQHPYPSQSDNARVTDTTSGENTSDKTTDKKEVDR
ncbi:MULTISPECIES: Sec-independent protein translocase protein TatB [Thalassotalea]|uniref:Sec-independent protein translocase protein TatB n=1 Tax=Thalassotalea TaxID=1518149 RepID=UPI000941F6D8|nr:MULTISPECIES: Sec-independent protein translocase protein TatB [Thalassotalea]OKY27013.1 twin arginine-targeting protein translocase TatB [Thalassotalea sp. PP2-459]